MHIKVSVTTGAKKESVIQKGEDSYVVSVREEAERGLANARVLTLLRVHFGSSKKVLRIVSGHQSPRKVILVAGVGKPKLS